MRPAPDAAGQQPVTLVLRPISSPLPLGFLALFTGSVLLSAVQLRWIPGTQSHFVAIGVLGIVVPLQLVSCVFGFLGRDPAFGTGMGVLSGTWAASGVSLLAAPPGQVEPALGVVLITAATALLVAHRRRRAGQSARRAGDGRGERAVRDHRRLRTDGFERLGTQLRHHGNRRRSRGGLRRTGVRTGGCPWGGPCCPSAAGAAAGARSPVA